MASCSSVLHAQPDSARLERTAYVLGSSLAFSLFDYVGYGLVRKNNQAPLSYRLLQVSVQAAISYFLYKQCGLSSAITFNLMWWTWCDDISFYGWGNLLNPSWPPWENRTHNGLMGRQIDWAYWTPIGLTRPWKSLIARDVLVAQAAIGFSVSIGYLLGFSE